MVLVSACQLQHLLQDNLQIRALTLPPKFVMSYFTFIITFASLWCIDSLWKQMIFYLEHSVFSGGIYKM